MYLSIFLTCFVALLSATVLLVVAGHRIHVASRVLGLLLIVAVTLLSGEIAARLWTLSTKYIVYGEVLLLASGLVAVAARRVWNPVGQLFFACFLAAAVAYLVFAVDITFGEGLSVIARLASFVLLLFELAALFLAGTFTF